jgi:hypothetical protein
MPKQTKQTATAAEPIVAEAPQATVEQKKRGRKPKTVDQSQAVPTNVESTKDKSSESKKQSSRGRKKDEAKVSAAATIIVHAKRPSTDYLFFCEEIRPLIMKENPTMTFREVGSE